MRAGRKIALNLWQIHPGYFGNSSPEPASDAVLLYHSQSNSVAPPSRRLSRGRLVRAGEGKVPSRPSARRQRYKIAEGVWLSAQKNRGNFTSAPWEC